MPSTHSFDGTCRNSTRFDARGDSQKSVYMMAPSACAETHIAYAQGSHAARRWHFYIRMLCESPPTDLRQERCPLLAELGALLPKYCSVIMVHWLEESHRIRGKGLTQLHFFINWFSRTFFVPPVCGSRRIAWRTNRGQEPSRPSQSRSSPPPGEIAALRAGIRRERSRLDDSGAPAGGQRHDARPGSETRFRLADAQSAIARKTGFASWPHLARHVEQLRALEGTWAFARLEIDGSTIPPAAMQSSNYSSMATDFAPNRRKRTTKGSSTSTSKHSRTKSTSNSSKGRKPEIGTSASFASKAINSRFAST